MQQIKRLDSKHAPGRAGRTPGAFGPARELPLTAFEELLFWTDQPAYPCVIYTRFHFVGSLDRDTVQEALNVALRRHPLLHSLIVQRGRQLHWSSVENPILTVQCQAGPTGGPMPAGGHMDLYKEIGIRARVIQDNETADLVLQFHHACVDGGGVHAFVNDFMLSYATLRGEDAPPVPLSNLDPDRLYARGTFGLSAWKLLKMLPKQLVGLVGAAQFFCHAPAPVLPPPPAPVDQSLPDEYPTLVTREFSKDFALRLRKVARDQGVTLNDLLSRELFLAMHAWRTENNVDQPRKWLRMMVPIDMRSKTDISMPAANVVSSIFLDRRGRDFRDPAALLQSVHSEMQLIKSLQLGFTFVFSLLFSRLIPGGLRRLSTNNQRSVSFVFTNMGSVFRRTPLPKVDGYLRMGDVMLGNIEALVPTGSHHAVTFTAHYYARRLTLTLNYDSRKISSQQADRLMALLGHSLHGCVNALNSERAGLPLKNNAA